MPQPKLAPSDGEYFKQLIREVPNFPKPGILFYDVTTLLKDKVGFAKLIDSLSQSYIVIALIWFWALKRGALSSVRH